MDNGFEHLRLYDWRQFDRVDLDLSQRLTVLTGANGAGKTTILTLLTKHFGWAAQFVAQPEFEKSGGFRFLSGWRRRLRKQENDAPAAGQQEIGELVYTGGVKGRMLVAVEGAATFDVAIESMRSVP